MAAVVHPTLLYLTGLASMYKTDGRGACGCTRFMINNEGRLPSIFQILLFLAWSGVGSLLPGVADLP